MATNGTPEQSNDAPQGGQPSGGGGFTLSGKTLGIAGGGAAALVVVIVVVVLFATGVFGGGGGGASGGGDVLAYVAGGAGAVIIGDNRALLEGNLPEDMLEHWADYESGGPFDEFPDPCDDLDIDDDDVATFAFVIDEDGNDSLSIAQGDFEFDVIREDLEDGADCEDDDYRGFELWECPDGGAVALFEKDGYLVFAAEQRQDDLEQLLTDKSRNPEKLADADGSDIKEILSRTGGGWLQFALITEDCHIERCEGFAIAVGESDGSDSMPASYAVMFSSERAAAASEGDVEIDDFLEEMFAGFDLELDIGEVKAEGEFVVGSGTTEFVEPGDTNSRSSNRISEGGNSRESERVQAAAPAAPTRNSSGATNTPLPARAWGQSESPAPMAAPGQEAFFAGCRRDGSTDLGAGSADLVERYCSCLWSGLHGSGVEYADGSLMMKVNVEQANPADGSLMVKEYVVPYVEGQHPNVDRVFENCVSNAIHSN